jgi:hypothetical protein
VDPSGVSPLGQEAPMKRVIAMLLIVLLIVPSASAAEKPGKPLAWEKVQDLTMGSTIFVTTGRGKPVKAQLLFADEATLFTSTTDMATLPNEVAVALYDVRAEWPAVARGEKDHTWGLLRISKDGVFNGDGKLYDLSAVVQVTSRQEVTKIAPAIPQVQGESRTRLVFAILGTIAVLVVAYILKIPDNITGG